VIDRFFEPDFLALMIPIVAIVSVFTWLILRQQSQHRERMAMIEQGMHPDRPELAEEIEEHDHELLER
jgi:sensor domain CHASE-containing protein